MLYPLLMNSLGIVVMVPTLLAAESSDVKTVPDVQPSLKWQLLISTLLLYPSQIDSFLPLILTAEGMFISTMMLDF